MLWAMQQEMPYLATYPQVFLLCSHIFERKARPYEPSLRAPASSNALVRRSAMASGWSVSHFQMVITFHPERRSAFVAA